MLPWSIDYAGLFPPASLDMQAAVQNYATYRAGPHAWALGRFVVPVSRLAEFEVAAKELLPRRPAGAPWLVTALVGADVAADLEQLGEFNCRHAADGAGAVSAGSIELKAASAQDVQSAIATVPPQLQAYVEIPIDADPSDIVRTLGRVGARAKVRTGGVTADTFPTTTNLVRFIRRCEESQVPFKATAGLHHPFRAEHALTYAPNSPRAAMYGFVNVFLAAAFIFAGMNDADASALLEEQSADAFRFDPAGVEWRGHRLSLDAIGNARDRAIISFGSCSFTEPITDLTALHWL